VQRWVSPSPGFLASQEGVRNRSRALLALGRIGVTSPEVVSTLRRGMADTNELVRFAALKSLFVMHQPLGTSLITILDTFSARNGTEFRNLIDWVGSLENEGNEAIPWVQKFTALSFVQGLPTGVRANVGWDLAINPEDLRQSAVLALCRINPTEVGNHVQELWAVGPNKWEAIQLLGRSKMFQSDIIATLAPMFTDARYAARAAYVVLGLAPNHEEALATLRKYAHEGSIRDRVFAAGWVWERTRDTEVAVPILIEGLKSGDDFACQVAPQIL